MARQADLPAGGPAPPALPPGQPLRRWLMVRVLLILLPMLAFLTVILVGASLSYRRASEQYLRNTARILSNAVQSELAAAARLIAASPQEPGGMGGTRFGTARVTAQGQLLQGPRLSESQAMLVLQAAASGTTAVSDLVLDENGVPLLSLAVPLPARGEGQPAELAVLTARPELLLRSVSRPLSAEPDQPDGDRGSPLVLSVSDSDGHILARSRGGPELIGQVALGWRRLQAEPPERRLFPGHMLDGPPAMFAFEFIPGTPGWTAMVAEPLESFNHRWQRPVLAILVAACGTALAALLLAGMLARRLLAPIERLIAHARAVAAPQAATVPLPATQTAEIQEFEILRRNLDEAEAALRRSAAAERETARARAAGERRYRAIAQIGALAFWARDEQARPIASPSEAQALAGSWDHEVLGQDWLRLVHPEDYQQVSHRWREAQRRGESWQAEFRLHVPDRGWRWLRARGTRVPGPEGAAAEWIGVLEDITTRKEVEQALQRSHDMLREAEGLARLGSWRLDLESGTFHASDTLRRLTGFAEDDPPCQLADLADVVHPPGLACLEAALAECGQSGQPFSLEIEYRRPDGSGFPAEVRGQLVRDAAGLAHSIAGTLQDVTERHEQRARLAALADNLPGSALLRLEEAPENPEAPLRISYLSTGVWEMLGLAAEEIVARPALLTAAIHPQDLPGYQAALGKAQREVSQLDHAFRARRAEGEEIWLQCRARPHLGAQGRPIWDGILRDITRERAAEAALRQAKEAAEATERGKGEFLAMMSHEIRTPLNAMLGLSRLALRQAPGPTQHGYLEKIDAAARSLLHIVNDVLDFSRIEAGGMALEETTFALEAVLESVAAATAQRAEEKGLDLLYDIHPAVPPRLMGDPLRLGQVLTNLVGNAVKFTEAGEVVVRIAPATGPAGEALLEYTVRDTGIGLSATQLSGLFRPFAQAEAHTARHYGGTGLGLAICRRLVGLMEGEIRAESQPGFGSTFRFTLPCRPAEPAATPGQERLAGRILIADDNATARATLQHLAQSLGLEAETAAEGGEALARLRRAAHAGLPFQLLLLDSGMPGLEGLTIPRHLAADPLLESLPVVLLGAGAEGAAARLARPVLATTLRQALAPVLGGVAAAPGPGPAGVEALPASLRAALAGRHLLVVDDNALNREVVGALLADAGIRADFAGTGEDALAWLRAAPSLCDAVLMDIHMPGQGGLATVREMRRAPIWQALPVIALTAHGREEDRRASLGAGMTAHLTKPIEAMRLYALLAELLAAPDAAPPSAGLDLATLSQRLGTRPGRVERLLQGFLRDFGEAGARMAALLAAGETDQAATLAHTVRGSAAYLGATRFCGVAQALEEAALRQEHAALPLLGATFAAELEGLLAAIGAALGELRDGPGAH